MTSTRNILLTDRAYKDHVEFWKNQLSILDEAFYFRRFLAQNQSSVKRTRVQQLVLDDATQAIVGKLTGNRDLGVVVVLYSALVYLISRYTGRSVVSIHSPLLAKSGSEEAYTDTVVLAQRINESLRIKDLLVELQGTVSQSYKYQNVPLQTIYAEDELVIKGSSNVLINYPGIHREFRRMSDYDLIVQVAKVAAGLKIELTFNEDAFDEKFISSFAAHYSNTLSQFGNVGTRLSDLRILSDDEERRIIDEWNSTGCSAASEKTIQELFEERVDRAPDSIATVYEGERLTYRELNSKANRLARHLRERLSVGPDDLVGILAGRSDRLVIAILAIIKAGGAYVPIDPDYPKDRIGYMIEDAGLKALLVDSEHILTVEGYAGPLFVLDAQLPALETPDENLEVINSPDNLAYVIYTSGSTGLPKGSMVSHRAISNQLRWRGAVCDLNAEDRLLQRVSFSFDASVWEFFGTLLAGARLVMIGQGDHLDTSRLVDLIAEHKITTLQIPPSMLQVFVEEKGLDRCGSLKRVISGGEALSVELQARFFSTLKTDLFHMYGPTEASIDATYWRCRPDSNLRTVPIGKPIANAQVYLLDPLLRPVPVGATGELYIGGHGLARGYLNDAGLTSERFIPDPFGGAKGARLYKTGDIGRYLDDGNIEFTGRVDHQVKIRGFRIEIGEVEAALSGCIGVKECLVTDREDSRGSKRLVAYLVPEAGASLSVRELRGTMKEKLPDFMIPSSFIFLSAIPLTTNGKVDRAALPAPDHSRPELEEQFVAPRDQVEELLARIWSEVLGIEQVGIHDNFFELGGDSILSIQIIARANEGGLRLSSKQIFQYQTIAELAGVASSQAPIEAEQGAVAGPVPLTPIQQRFFELDLAEPHHFNQALLLEVARALEPRHVMDAVRELLAHHDALRLRQTRWEDTWRQVNDAASEDTILEVIDLSGLSPQEQETRIRSSADELQAGLNLPSGPLARFAYYNLGKDQPGRLLIVIHHLVVDGVSWRILLEDLQTACEQALRGAKIQLPAKTTSFKQWAERLLEYAQTESVERELSYWQAELSREVSETPVDFHGGNNSEGSADVVNVKLSEEDTKALLYEVPEIYGTQIDEVLLTALARTLNRWTGGKAILVDMERHGREELIAGIDLSRTVGWFTNVFPLVVQVDDDDLGRSLKRVKEKVRQTPNKGMGYGLLRYLRGEGKTKEKLKGLADAELSFNYLGQFDQVMARSELFAPARESIGSLHSPKAQRRYLVEINAGIAGGRLQAGWVYSPNLHERETVERAAGIFVEELTALIRHCQAVQVRGFTPSDFPVAAIDQDSLDRLIQACGEVEDVYPLSPMQQGLLFHSLYSPEFDSYYNRLSCEIEGELNIPAFEQAWQEAARRHTSLRTAFYWGDLDKPYQVVRRDVQIPLTREDWRAISEAEQEKRLESFLQSDRDRGFDLTQAPLTRLTLIQLNERTHHLVWSHHHLVLDGWSVSLLLKEVFALYEGLSRDKAPRLQRPRPYRDYIAWLQDQDLPQVETFWRSELAGFCSPTALPTDKVVSRRAGYGEERSFLSEEATAALEAFARRHQVTLNTIVEGAWAIALSRYSGEKDVVFGTVVSGRPAELAGVESIVGLFINTVALRVKLPMRTSVVDWLRDLQNRQARMSRYEYSPLMQVQAWSEVPRGTPLFESLFIFENYPVDSSLGDRIDDLRISRLSTVGRTNYPITIVAAPGQKFLLRVAYEYGRFGQDTIRRMLGHLETVLEAIATDESQVIGEISLLKQRERVQLLEEWSAGSNEYPRTKCVHQFFEEQASRAPDAYALTFEQQNLTYGQLNARANQLAHYLQALGVGPDVLVAVYTERSIETVTAILAILKAGAAYVPLDPAYPKDRLAFILEDSCAPVILTQREIAAGLPPHNARVVYVDSDWREIAQMSRENCASRVSPDNLAYVIYTSGSTGKPKGVPVSHYNVVRLFEATEDRFGFNPDDVWTLFHSYAFDFSVWELWGALLYGGRLVIVPYLVSRSPESFYDLLKRERVTVLNQTPSAFRQMIQEDLSRGDDGGLCLRTVIFGGEALDLQMLKPWFEKYGDDKPHLINMYGITETTVHVTYRRVTYADVSAKGSVIGGGLADLQVYVLDERMEPSPTGVAGEMYVSGGGVARGYLNRPELTAERFVPDPFAARPGERLYRSGDQARYLGGGDIEYLGRVDDQVKIRGFRIEPGEIEAVLAQHDEIRDARVIIQEDSKGEKRLVAYVVGDEATISMGRIRAHLKETLPEYMVPSAIVTLRSLPLTPNGKLDRRALPAPDQARPELEEEFVMPATDAERILAEIWTRVLGVEQVGVHDNFFALGGDSIRSLQVRSQAEQQGLHFSLEQLFRLQTIHGLLDELGGLESSEGAAESEPFSFVSKEDRQTMGEEIEDAYPLTKLQAGMLFHTEYSPESAIFHDVFSYHFRARLDEQALRMALAQLIARHPILRTSFDLTRYDQFLQLVHRDVDLPLQVDDLSHLSPVEQEQSVSEWIEAEKNRPFDWSKAPLLRFQIHVRSDETFQFTLSFHHSLLDGWSVATMLTELFQGYLSLLGKESETLHTAPRAKFRDYVALELRALESEESRKYWERKLDESAACAVPRWPNPLPGARSGMLDVPIPADVSDRLKAVAQILGVPLKSVLMAAHLRVISVVTGKVDVLTGASSNGRPEGEEGDRVLGLFLNMLPVRMAVKGGTWTELVKQVFDDEREMLPHRRYPLAELQRMRGGEQLFETLFNYVHFHVYDAVKRFDDVQMLGGDSFEESNFTLTAIFGLDLNKQQVQLHLNYDARELLEEQVKMIGECYANALSALAANPDDRYEENSLLSQSVLQPILIDWNETNVSYADDACVHRLFEQQVQRTPDAPALIFEDQRMSYRELNEKANQLARRLRSLGVSSETLVGLYIERSLELVVATLAVLKAGGAYLPLDPAFTTERFLVTLADSLSVLLTQRRLEGLLPRTARVLTIDLDSEIFAQEKTTDLDADPLPESTAYVIYTSGSTGKPKGVQLTHRALRNLAEAQITAFQVEAQSRVLQFASYSFDASVSEVFTALLSGATLHLGEAEFFRAGTALAHFLRENAITVVTLPPSVIATISDEEFPQLRTLVAAGESCPTEIVKRWAPACRFLNAYGPTETTVCATIAEFADGDSNPVIGRPISNVRVYLLDQHLTPAPVGTPGELFVGGVALARGYLNQPDLTAERFIPDPFGNAPGSRLYRTGDLARRLPDGNIEFLGRVDQQVKVRGFRIELGEIEAALREHPGITDCAVTVNDAAGGDRRLIGYVIANGARPGVNDIREWLRGRLPEYAVPSAIVMMDALPLSRSGKIDRRALPSPDGNGATGRTYVAPRTAMEELLSGIWSDVLGVKQVGVDDSFFDLGGHSLLATQIMSRVRTALRAEVPLRALFEARTVGKLAESVEAILNAKERIRIGDESSITRVSRNGSLPLSFAQQRLWFLEQLFPDSAMYNCPAAVRVIGALEVPALERAVSEIVRRHESLRTSFPTVGGQPVQSIAPPRLTALDVIDLSGSGEKERGDQLTRLIADEAARRFDIEAGPLFRACLIRLKDREHVFLLNMHHIISDGWSVGIFIREMAALYEAFSSNRPSPLSDLPIQYADFACWQRQWMQGEVLEKLIDYWKQQLEGASPELNLPTDRPRTAVDSFRGASASFELSADVTEALNQLSHREGGTLFMTLVAALQSLLHRYSGQEDILIGTDIANRNRAETEGIIGFFINLLVLRGRVKGDQCFRELLAQVHETTLGAYAHQDLPFEKLVEAVRADRVASQSPLFQVLFVLQNAASQIIDAPGLKLESIEIESGVARFDLTLFMGETERGLAGTWKYNADLFDRSTISRMSGHFETLLKSIAANPDTLVRDLEMFTEEEKAQQAMKQKRREKARVASFKQVKPRTVRLPQGRLVRTSYLLDDEMSPLVIEPGIEDFDPISWVTGNRGLLDAELVKHGAVLFRGFALASTPDFEKFAESVSPDLFGDYGDLPREGVSGKVYGSTPYPSDQAILFHNESSHMHRWPMKIWFFCVKPAERGGETPIVDCRKVCRSLDPKIVKRFAERKLMYVRNYISGIDVSWQEFFRTTDRQVVEKFCRDTSVDFEWKDGDGLMTRRICQAVAKHPKTGEDVFFNQIQLHHVSCLDRAVRDSMLSMLREEDLPRNVYYGDGTPIEDSIVEEICHVYESSASRFPWQQSDILLLDNMLTAHGRSPYTGARKIVVAMAEMFENKQLGPALTSGAQQ